MFASAHGDNLRQDRDCYLIRRDRAKIETCGRLEIAQTFRGNAPLASLAFSTSAFLRLPTNAMYSESTANAAS
jgi:hypothetical protein